MPNLGLTCFILAAASATRRTATGRGGLIAINSGQSTEPVIDVAAGHPEEPIGDSRCRSSIELLIRR